MCPNTKAPVQGAFVFGGEGGIRSALRHILRIRPSVITPRRGPSSGTASGPRRFESFFTLSAIAKSTIAGVSVIPLGHPIDTDERRVLDIQIRE